MATINGMYVLAESEDPKYEIDITNQPVEDGSDITDHVQRKPSTMDVSGYIVGEDAAQVRDKIKQAMENGEIVTFQGRNLFVGLITSFSTKHDYKVANGCPFSLSLKEIEIAKSSYVKTLPAPIRAQVAPIISSGRKQKKTKGTGTGKAKKKEEEVKKVKFKPGTPWADK